MLDRAIFTAPAHPFWGGAALIAGDGSLIGVGSLHVQHSNGRELRRDVNMIVPIDLLPPILEDLLTFGRPNRPARPWLGLYATEVDDAIVVAGLSERGPAVKTGLRPGDRWCLCAPRWQEALEHGKAPRVVLRATHQGALSHCSLADLKKHAIDLA